MRGLLFVLLLVASVCLVVHCDSSSDDDTDSSSSPWGSHLSSHVDPFLPTSLGTKTQKTLISFSQSGSSSDSSSNSPSSSDHSPSSSNSTNTGSTYYWTSGASSIAGSRISLLLLGPALLLVLEYIVV